jgi:hypothetical protein
MYGLSIQFSKVYVGSTFVSVGGDKWFPSGQ